MSNPVKHLYEFGAFFLDPEERMLRLRASGDFVPLTPKAFETLLVLVENRGNVLTKEALIERVWPDSFVEENNLMQNISTLRKALGESAEGGQKFIETVPKRGYRFVSSVTEKVGGEDAERAASLVEDESIEIAQSPIETGLPVTDHVKRRKVSLALFLLFLLALLISASAYLTFRRVKESKPAAELRTLAILPFRNLKPDPETDFIGFSLADAVITKLGYVSALTVRPSSYVEQYRQEMIDPVVVAHDLNVNTLLTGSFFKDGDDLRINAQLIDVRTKDILWRETIDVKYERLLTVQDRVAQQIIKGLAVNLSADEAKRLDLDAPRSPLAYEYYLRGVDRYATSEYSIAIEMLEKSLAIDPNYAPAWAQLGTTYSAKASFRFGGRDYYQKALVSYEKAFASNPELIEARIFMANTFTDTNRAEQAVPLLREALRTNENYASAHWELGYAYRFAGMLEPSIAECERARALDPEVKLTSSALNSYLYTGDYQHFLQSLPANENSAFILFYRGFGNFYLKNWDRAAADFDHAYELDPDLLQAQIGKALSYAITHQNAKGIKMLQEIEARVQARGVADAEGVYKIAQAYNILGDRTPTLRVLQRSIEGGFFCYPYLRSDALMENLRGVPEYDALLEQARRRHESFKTKFF